MRTERLYNLLAKPIIHEWVFFTAFSVLMGKLLIRAVLYIPVNGLPQFSWWYNAGEVLLLAYLFTYILYKIRGRWRVMLYALTFAAFFIREFLKNVFVKDISSEVLMLLAETTPRETGEFFGEYLFSRGTLLSVCVTACLAIAVWWASRYRRRVALWLSATPQRRFVLGVVAVSMLLWGVVASFSFVRMFQCRTVDELSLWELTELDYSNPFTQTVNAAYGLHLSAKDMHHFIRVTSSAARKPCRIVEEDSLNIIVVVGESYIKWHSNLYGYPLKTCPYQQAEADSGRLYPFNAVYTCSNYTSTALKNVFSTNCTERGEAWNDAPFFPVVMKSAGYDVYMWDNQREAFSSTGYTFSLNSFLYHQDVMPLSYTATNSRCFDYDMDLIDNYARSVRRKARHNLVIFHLMGQHFVSNERFPVDRYSHFTPRDVPNKAAYLNDDKRQLIADYDNATLYNDHVLKRIMDLYRDESTVVIYFSDHGEEIYDYRDSKGRVEADGCSDYMYRRYQYEVPFTIWCSDAYRQHHPDQVEAIRANVDRCWNTDDLCHLVFRLATVKTPYYRPERDVLSNSYKAVNSRLVPSFPDSILISHAGGMIGGLHYTNTKEALQNAIAVGYRYVELDLALTRDSTLVCSHGFEDFAEDYVPTLREFREHRFGGKYTTMTLADAVAIWRPSKTVLVTDKISDPALLNRYFRPSERHRVYVETSSKQDFLSLRAEGYVPMYNIHHFNALSFLYFLKLRHVDGLPIDRITVNTDSSPWLLHYIRQHYGVKVAMYTSNSPDFIQEHLGYDADLIYTDNWTPASRSPFSNIHFTTY